MKWALLSSLLLCSLARAQVLNPSSAPYAPNVVSATFGVDGPGRLDVGYARVLTRAGVAMPHARLHVSLLTRVSMPLATDFEDLTLATGADLAFVIARQWFVAPRLELSATSVETTSGRLSQLGLGASVRVGFTRHRGAVGLEGAWEGGIATYVHVSDFYRSTGYANAPSGLRAGGGGIFRFGAFGSVRIVRELQATLRVGIARSQGGNAIDFIPAYAMLGLLYGF